MNEVSGGEQSMNNGRASQRERRAVRADGGTHAEVVVGGGKKRPGPKPSGRSPGQKAKGRTGAPEKSVGGSSRQLADKSAGPGSKTASCRGKLSLRRDAGRRGAASDKPAALQSRVHQDVMKAILGETTLNQSSDFKEPYIRGAVQGPKARRKAPGPLRSRSKGNKLQTAAGASVTSASPDPVLIGRTEEAGTRSPRVQQNAPGLSRSENAKAAAATVAECSVPAATSPLKACSVQVPRLKLTRDSPSPSQESNDPGNPGISHKVPSRKQSPLESDKPPGGDVNAVTRVGEGSAPGAGEVQLQSACQPPRSPPGGAALERRCPVCEVAVPADSAAILQSHMQRCLRSRFANSVGARDVAVNSEDTSGDEELARMLQRREEEKRQEESLMDSDRFFCQICQRELSHLNSTRRAQHLNRCIDNNEAVEPQPRSVTSRNQPKEPVRDCPICGKHFKTKKGRESHLKSCARQQNVSPQQLIALVRVQEEAAPPGQGDVGTLTGAGTGGTSAGAGGGTSTGAGTGGTSAGAGGSTSAGAGTSSGATANVGSVAHSSDATGGGRGTAPRPANARGRGGRNAARGRSATRGKGRPKRQPPTATVPLHEETQVALALSASLAQQPDPVGSTEGAVALSVIAAAQAPPQQSAGKPGRKRRAGKKATSKEVPLLMRRTADEHARVLGARMADIILNQENASIHKTPSLTRSKVAARYGGPLPGKSPTCIRLAEAFANQHEEVTGPPEDSPVTGSPSNAESVPLWSLASASDGDGRKPFYVHQLLPAVTPQKRGQPRLRHFSHRAASRRQREPDQEKSMVEDTLKLRGTTFISQEGTSIKEGPSTKESSTKQEGSNTKEGPASREGSATRRGPASQESPINLEGPITQKGPITQEDPFSQEGFTTQALGRTVQILAELAAESAPHPYTQAGSSSLNTASGFIPSEEEDVYSEEEKACSIDEDEEESMIAVNHHQLEILHSLSGLVNSEELSDLHLVTSDGSVVFAHQFLMKLRCPSIAQLIEDSPSCSRTKARRLDLQDFDRGAVLCVLDFVYAGKVTVTSSAAEEVLKLSKRFSLSKLSDFCRHFCKENRTSLTAPKPEENQKADLFPSLQSGKEETLGHGDHEFIPDKGLDELIQSLWDSSDDEGNSRHKQDEDIDEESEDDSNKKTPIMKSKRKSPLQASDTESEDEAQDSAPDDKEFEEIYEFFSTQRQQNRERSKATVSDDQSEDTSDEPSDEEVADDEEDDDEDDDKENFEEVSLNCTKQPVSILEHLQSSCRPCSEKASCLKENLVPSPGAVASKRLTPERKPKRRQSSERSKDDFVDSSSGVITPCFVHVTKLSNDVQVSPFKEKLHLTVGACLEHQGNLKTAVAEKGKKTVGDLNILREAGHCEELVGEEDTTTLKEADATLADVGDSIFKSNDEDERDVEMISITQSGESGSHNEDGDLDGGDQDIMWSGESLFRSSSPESSVSKADEVESCVGVVSMHRGIPGSSIEDESLPFVDVRSQLKNHQPQEHLGSGTRSIQDEGIRDGLGSDDKPSTPDDVMTGSQESFNEEVIDLSQDDEWEMKEGPAAGGDEDADGVNGTEEDVVVEYLSSTSKTLSSPSGAHHHAENSPPVKPAVIRPQKFTFRRRGRQANSEEPGPPPTSNAPSTPAMGNAEMVKLKSTDPLCSVAETPATFRSAAGVIRDSSTPVLGQNCGEASRPRGHVSPKVSPVKDTTHLHGKVGKTVSGLTGKDISSRKRCNETLGHENTKDGSPVLGSSTGKKFPRGINEYPPNSSQELEWVGQSRGKAQSLSPKSKFTARSGLDSEEEEDGGPDSPCLSGTPLRPTPDCFDADTPELIRSISPELLSPSPPPSPTFGSVRGLKSNDGESRGSQRLDGTIIDDEGSAAKRCKRKLPNERDGAELEAPSKRYRSQEPWSSTPSILDANCLSPACVTEDDVVLVSNEDYAEEEAGTAFEPNRGTSGVDGGHSWPEQLCVGFSPTRTSPDSPSDDERTLEEDVSVVEEDVSIVESLNDASTPRLLINETLPCQEPSTTPKRHSFPASPTPIGRNSDSQEPSGMPSASASRSCSPIRRRYTGDTIEPRTSSQTSASGATPLSPHNVTEEQFAYFGDDGGGYMDEFHFCSDGETGAEEPATGKKSQRGQGTGEMSGGLAVSPEEKPSATKPTSLRSPPSASTGRRGHISIRSFSSSEEDAPSSGPAPYPGPSPGPSPSRDGGSSRARDPRRGRALQLREEAEEFGCSESFLSELKAGNVDEEDAWGGVCSSGGGPSMRQSAKIASRVGPKPVPATPVVNSNQPMSKERIDALYHPPAPITPMPPYDDMNTPLLKNALKTYGVKPLPKKKARLKLKEIYTFTHQVLEDSDSDTDKSGPVPFKPFSGTGTATSSKRSPPKARPKTPSPAKRTEKSSTKLGCQDRPEEEAAANRPRRPCIDSNEGGESQSPDGREDSDGSDYSSNKECPEGDCDEDEEDDLEPSQRTSEHLEDAIKVYIKTNTDLYEKILCYEPLELDDFHGKLKKAGIRYAKKKLRCFLDYHGITCRVASSNTNRHERKTKRPKAKK